MRQKNHKNKITRIGDLQNRFTAYALKAVRRRRQRYLQILSAHVQTECVLEGAWIETLADNAQEIDEMLPLAMRLESSMLLYALKSLNSQELDILLSHVLEDQGFDALAERYSLKYKAIAQAYYRAIRKLRRRMGG